MDFITEKTCCFTGHRPEKLNISETQAKELLKNQILNCIEMGITTFISGMARGIDMWGAEIVLELKEHNKDLALVCAIPFDGFEKNWSMPERNRYNYILSKCSYKEYICSHYIPACFQIRNVWMVNRSSLVLAMYTGAAGGTKNTIKYAKENNVPVKNILIGT